MPCKGSQQKSNGKMVDANWYYKCRSCGAGWYWLAHNDMFHSKNLRSDYNIDFMGGTASVSQSTGTLTILNFQSALEGLYKCHPVGYKPYVMELKSACESIVQVSHRSLHITNGANNTLRLQNCK